MPVSIVVGGQFGSEGKGKTSAYFAEQHQAKYVIRVGGTNSGHTVYCKAGNKYALRQLPTASINSFSNCILPAGSYIDLKILKEEIDSTGISTDRVLIDPMSVIISDANLKEEKDDGLIENIGSTGSGTGAAVRSRISRTGQCIFAKDIPELKIFLCDTKKVLRDALNKNERVIIEGTQGYGLSLYHSEFYPNTTSRDTTAAGFLSEAGLSPLDVDEVVMVIRTYPIRVAGNSGPLPNELTWEELSDSLNLKNRIYEHTTATNKLRRVARFDSDIVKKAIDANNPTSIVLNHIDYIPDQSRQIFISKLESQINRKIDYIGNSAESILRYE
ncbi:Adenylosuccinate synthetase [Thalassolituus maritimus]|uniref:Adenylosuccinate synthetase n=1 Tax=Thalassolituus maritimus TaxID=484498 RepID=A0A1N7JUP4_9GAMM|nr:adenylosuccinate synthetase [Thalassolituus maritimus]SIS53057.1 Adenylosuccinate synthetase [Thalassolituus maritimus]